MSLSNTRISRKLPVSVALAVLACGTFVGIVNFHLAKEKIIQALEDRMRVQLEDTNTKLEEYFSGVRQDVTVLGVSLEIVQGTQEFTTAWREFDSYQEETLQRAYGSQSQKNEALDFAADGSSYSDIHRKYHPWFRAVARERGYQDIFLFDLKGNLIYSVYKGSDYATNFFQGRYKDSGLGKAYSMALNASPGEQFFVDMEPYEPNHGEPASFISTPVFSTDGKKTGVMALEISVSTYNKLLYNEEFGQSGHTYLVGPDRLMWNDSPLTNQNDVLKTHIDSLSVSEALEGNAGVSTLKDFRGLQVYSAYTPFNFMGRRWALVEEIDMEHILTPVSEMRNATALIAICSSVIIAFLGVIMARSITQPLARLNKCLHSLASGDTSVEIPYADRGDEIGEIAHAMDTFKESAIRNKKLEAERVEAKRQAEEERVNAMRMMALKFEQRVQSIINTVASGAAELFRTAETLTSTISDVTSKASNVSAAAEQTSGNVQTVAAAAEEMTSSVREISSQVTRSTQVVRDAVTRADKADESTKLLEGAAAQIGDVVQLIKDIAEQINLLALNATIESARAGEAGKGFAVVASEVKNLATQTTKATEEIAAQIESIQNISTNVVLTLKNIQEAINNVNEYAGGIASAVEEQSAVTEEITSNMHTAASGTLSIQKNITDVSVATDRARLSSEQVLEASRLLSREAEDLSREVAKFLGEVRG